MFIIAYKKKVAYTNREKKEDSTKGEPDRGVKDDESRLREPEAVEDKKNGSANLFFC